MTGFWSSLSRRFRRQPLVTVLRLSGVIGGGGRFSRGLEDASLAGLIERAFKPKRLDAVALAINSPGGSPAQSSLIAQRIRDHAAERGVPVLAFCEDVAASGGYMLACAADEIWAERNSILGSIGVISASFGFSEAIQRLGVERRLQTAGAAKARLDPFSPLKAEDEAWLSALQNEIHKNFIEMVKSARGDRLGAEPPDAIFSGEVFLGEDAVRLGLADGVGRLRPVLRERFGEEVRIEPVTRPRGLLSRLSPFSGAAPAAPEPQAAALDGLASAEAWIAALERRALWSRYGL
ncbi:MAG: S49 family peptidase [Pseudomonadota bacterium]